MSLRRSEIRPESTEPLHSSARKDLIGIAAVVVFGCLVILWDPRQAFERVAEHRAVQFDELLAAIILIGAGFATFSWRRWVDLSRQVAEYKRLQTELSAISRASSMMSETDDRLQSCLSSQEAYEIIIRHLEMQFPSLSGAIFSIAQTHGIADLVAKWGKPSLTQNDFPMKDCWALRRGHLNISLASDPRVACAHIGPAIPAYAMCLPMMAQGEILGVLYLETGAPGVPNVKMLNESEERVIKTLAEHLALAVANLNLRETLRTQSIRDPLTGLFNRRYMEEFLEREISRALRTQSILAVILVDVDLFKQVNDSFGHEAGDVILREMAKLFQAQLREGDIASRFGGEEFSLILPDTDMEAAAECAERFRRAVRVLRLQHYEQTLEGITISIGLACFPQHGSTAGALVRAADVALYRAKEQGRDRIVSAETLQ